MSTIASLEITNFQRINAVKIEPTNNVIMLCGKNAEGKTSVLDAIETTFTKFNARVTKRPVKDGAGRADIKITLTDGTKLHQKFIPSGPTLTGENPDGKKISQKDVDLVISALGVDAAAFINAGEKEQLKTLLSVVDLPFSPAVLDAQRKTIFDERTAVSRDVKRLEGQASGFLAFPVDTPTEEVSVRELVDRRDEAQTFASDFAAAKSNVAWWDEQIVEKEEHLRQMVEDLETSKARRKVAVARVDEYATIPVADVYELTIRIDNAEQINANVRGFKAAQAVNAHLSAARDDVEQLTSDLAEIDQRKADGLANAEMPVDGLSFDEEGVLYQGVPFSRASGAEQIIVSAAMIIATDPEVRTMVIRNGNVMDEDSLAVLQAMCEDNSFQAFVEFVSDSEDHEFRLVDGELAA